MSEQSTQSKVITSQESVTSDPQATKIIVAIHGIGDQFQFATIQTVANRFCSYFQVPHGIPLGSFHAKQVGGTDTYLFEGSKYSDKLTNIGFAEVYWAPIPRKPAQDGHTLEESKKWAKTLIERLRIQRKEEQGGLSQKASEKVQEVLHEMIETIAVLDRLCFLAEKAGVFKFDLRKILVDYLGDVQVVTEFEGHRQEILEEFFSVMRMIVEHYPNAKEIYIVAHSEGTVVSFLGLLTAMCEYRSAANNWRWLERVRGYLTIGSPIDKHIILWPELWKKFEKKDVSSLYHPSLPIQWRNFYDHGDPIGFELNTAREWLEKHNLDKAFNFDADAHDIGFSRYWFPGKAHNDYWNDEQLFGNFIKDVVREPVSTDNKNSLDFSKPPGSKILPRLTTKIAPYLLFLALMLTAVYILYKAVGEALPLIPEEPAREIFRNVAGLTSLLVGVTLMARVPRLTNLKFGLPIGVVGFALFTTIFYFLLPYQEPGNRFSAYAGQLFEGLKTGVPFNLDPLIGLAIVVVIVVYLLNHIFPKLGLYTLLLPGFLAVIGMVTYRYDPKDHGPLWPVFLALLGFLYLWWLAALVFDLIFVWHSYIYNSRAINAVRVATGWQSVR
jgi:hypothetical protein